MEKKKTEKEEIQEIEHFNKSAQAVRNYYNNLNIDPIDRRNTAEQRRNLFNNRCMHKRKLLEAGKKINWNYPGTKFKPVLVVKA